MVELRLTCQVLALDWCFLALDLAFVSDSDGDDGADLACS